MTAQQDTGPDATRAPDAGTATTRRPMTGDEYIESLRDGQEVWL